MHARYESRVQAVDILIPTAMPKPILDILEPCMAMAATVAVMEQGQQTTTATQRLHHFTRNVGGALVLPGPGAEMMLRL